MILGELVYRTASRLGVVIEGVISTTTTTTTVIDTKATSTKEFGNKVDDFYNGGTVGIFNPVGSIVEWEYSEVKDSIQASQKLVVQDAFSAAVTAGDRYWIAKRNTPLRTVEQKINQVLSEWELRVEDKTSITTEDSKREYTLPVDASLDLRRVELDKNPDDADANEWEEIMDWEIIRTATGTADTLRLTRQPPSGRALKLTYIKPHPRLYAYSDVLDGSIHGDLIAVRAAMRILEDRLEVDPREELQNRWNLLADTLNDLESRWDHRGRNEVQQTVKLNTRFARSKMGPLAGYSGDRNVIN